MAETVHQYYFKTGLFGQQVLWVKKTVFCRQYDFSIGIYRDRRHTVERKATQSEAASLLPVLNAGLSPAS